MSPFHRWFIKSARTVHLYVTLFGLALLAFFAVTGFMLNHEHWFIDPEKEPRVREGIVPAPMLKPLDKLAIVEMLRKDYGATGAVNSQEVKEEDNPIRIVFQQPGRRVEAEIYREPDEPDDVEPNPDESREAKSKDGELKVHYFDDGFAGILLDLHKGKATGRAWKLVMDGLCILVLVIAGTGLILWGSLRGRGRFSLIVLLMDIGLGIGVFFLLVPR